MKYTLVSSRKLRKLFIAMGLAALVIIGLAVTLALAIEIPPAGSVAFIQTSGPNTALNIGDWYSRIDQGNRAHTFRIYVPCTVPPAQVFSVALFDPELFAGVSIDEIRGTPDTATFELRAPDNSLIHSFTYTPSATTNDILVPFTTFTTGGSGCGIYTLSASTSDDDDNAWRLSITPDDVDGSPGTGDELSLAAFESSFQHAAAGCQDFFFFVPGTSPLQLNNFDMDFPGVDASASVTYFPPGGAPITVTPSGSTVWNGPGGSASTRVGDVFATPTPGWWSARLCVGITPTNQYIFEPQGLAYFFQPPLTPTMTVGKDDGLTLVGAGQIITYTITYANSGQGAALNVTLTDNLPASTTFVSCSGGTSCGEAPPGSGVVNYAIGTVVAGTGGQVFLTVQVDPAAPPSTVLTNTVQLDYQDTLGNQYPPERATDVDILTDTVAADLSIVKTDNPDPVAAGALLNYTLVVANAGPDDAQNVMVVDTLPAGVTFVSSTPSQGTCTGLSCALGTILVNGQANIVVVVRVNIGTAGPLLNSAQVSSDTPDPNPRNNRDDEPTTILTQGQTPTPTPTRPPSTSGRRDEPDPTATPIPAAPPAVPAAPPTPAVTFLPETGVGGVTRGVGLWPLALLPGLGLLGWAIFRRRGK